MAIDQRPLLDPATFHELHPFVRGLFLALPPPGALWPEEKRRLWLEAAEGIFGLIYKD